MSRTVTKSLFNPSQPCNIGDTSFLKVRKVVTYSDIDFTVYGYFAFSWGNLGAQAGMWGDLGSLAHWPCLKLLLSQDDLLLLDIWYERFNLLEQRWGLLGQGKCQEEKTKEKPDWEQGIMVAAMALLVFPLISLCEASAEALELMHHRLRFTHAKYNLFFSFFRTAANLT